MTNDGGAAFPLINWKYPSGVEGQSLQEGMSLRDWFAGQALIGILASGSVTRVAIRKVADKCKEAETKTTADVCYEYADAMLQQRGNG